MQRPIPVGDPENENYPKVMDALYGLLGDDELFDSIGELQDKKGAKADARPVIMKWFAQRIKDKAEKSHQQSRPNRFEKAQSAQLV